MEVVNIACVDHSGFWGISFTHYKRLPSVTVWDIQRPPSFDLQFGYECDSIDFIVRSASLVIPQTQKMAGEKIPGFERKSFTRRNFPDSKLFGFKVPNLNSGCKISTDMTKSGSFYFRFVPLCVNVKTNPVLKRHSPVLSGIWKTFLSCKPSLKAWMVFIHFDLYAHRRMGTFELGGRTVTLFAKKHYTTIHILSIHNTTQHNTTQHNTTQHNTTQHNTTQHNTTQHNTAQHSTTQHNTAQHSTAQQSKAK